jgi:hypothetical protein
MVIIRREDRTVRERGLPLVVCRDGDGRMVVDILGGMGMGTEEEGGSGGEAELTAKEELARFA